jgi:hypothetical protein
MRVTFLLDAHTLSSEPEEDGNGAKMNVSLFAAVYDLGGKMLSNRGIKVDRTFDAVSYKQIMDKGMMVPIDMDMPAGGTEIRLAVVDNKTGFIGTVSGAVKQ